MMSCKTECRGYGGEAEAAGNVVPEQIAPDYLSLQP